MVTDSTVLWFIGRSWAKAPLVSDSVVGMFCSVVVLWGVASELLWVCVERGVTRGGSVFLCVVLFWGGVVSCVWGTEVLIWGADNAWKPSAWVLCLIVPWYPPVTFILRPLVQSQANFDMRKGCKGCWGAWGGFLKEGEGEKDRVSEVWNKIAFYPTVQR